MSMSSLPTTVAPTSLAGLQESVGPLLGHGAYQRRMLVCGIACVATALTQFISNRLIGRPVDHWCQPLVELRHLSADTWKNLSIPIEADGSFSKCTMFDPPVLGTVAENRTVIECRSWDYDIADKGDSIVSRFDLVCSRQYLYPLSSLFTSLSYTILSPVAGFASDRIGRKPVTVVCAFILVFSLIGCSVAKTFTFFLVNRALAMAAGNGGYLLTFILLYEGTGPSRRWLFLLLQTAVPGTIVPPVLQILSWQSPSWALAQALIITPAAIFGVCCFLLEESPAWLLATWKVREAEEGVLLAAKVNGQDADKARRGFRVLLAEMGKLLDSNEPTYMASATEGILETMRMRRLAVAAFFSRFTLSGVYFGLVFSDNTSGYFWLGVFFGLSTSTYCIIILAVNRYGIRETLSAVLAITCCSAVAKFLMTLSGEHFATPFVHAAMKAVVSGSMSVVMWYAGDAFPTKIRCAGVSLSVFFGGIGSYLGMFLAKLKTEPEGVYFSMYVAVMTMLSVVAVQWLPEVFIEKPKEVRSLDIPSPEVEVVPQFSLTESTLTMGKQPQELLTQLMKYCSSTYQNMFSVPKLTMP
ncbi:hypothetical protein V5799_033120 [Amblyomma americanum]|uniref:Major facilitator superfamily (MFS) profile domain-containing protein n=1 Tax=Amblyomma americanum TaxID=6943 RepID=A0AAQ4DP82_AMBAM